MVPTNPRTKRGHNTSGDSIARKNLNLIKYSTGVTKRVITATAYKILARRWNLNKVEKITVINCSNANLWDNKKLTHIPKWADYQDAPNHIDIISLFVSKDIIFHLWLEFELWKPLTNVDASDNGLGLLEILKWYGFKSNRQNKLQLIIIEYFVALACKNVRCQSFFFCKKCDAPNQKGTSKNNLSAVVPDWFLRPCR